MINPFKRDTTTTKKQQFFSSTDAWVFASLWGYDTQLKDIDLNEIAARGDLLNHSVLELEEIVLALNKLQQKGLIVIQNEKLAITNEGMSIKERIVKKRGGLFSIIPNTESILNSPRTKLESYSAEKISSCEFLLRREYAYGVRKD
ncbi:hypothetical protein [Roseivirga thermotolerans]|uniref:Uncharacterized protein n=1 Tax=Roseivirga thermotolerans TaxID=1758176 RepID=A0ABQ3I6F2_9BACT|nr:hypothetical protein [Roseivirga thermotolerans]GHE54046.1 hypothetical protein GCM10011340_05750 [Roseivirga thermotolerans]